MGEHSNPQAETWVLGALMDADGPLLKTTAHELSAAIGLHSEDFTSAGRRAIFETISSLAGRQRPCDANLVWGLVRGSPGIGADGFEGLQSMQASNSANRAAVLSHAEEIKRLSALRRLEAFYQEQQALLSRPRPDPVALAQRLGEFSHAFSAGTEADETGSMDVSEIMEEWDAFVRGEREPYLRTGIEALDEVTGGFVCNLNVVGGMPSVGKSALIGEIIMACLERGQRVGLFGLEDATKWLPRRHISRSMGMPVGSVGATRLHEHQWSSLSDQANTLSNTLRNLFVYRRAGIEPSALVDKCKHWILNRGCQAIFVDHGGEVQHESHGRDRFDLAVANTYRQLRDLAINYRVPVVVLCHFNRDTATQHGGVPTMQSFAETEYIARMARLALGLWDKPGDSRLRCTVLKRTEGRRGVTVGLRRDEEHALVHRHGGEVVDTQAESESERQQRSWKKSAG